MPKRKAPRKGAATPADPSRRIIDAALDLAAEKPWHTVSLAQIASAAALPLSDVFRYYRSKPAIVAGYLTAIDAETLGAPVAGDSVRDKLFDAIMRRFDALEARKAALKSIMAAAPRDPIAALCGAPRFLRSIAMLAENAGVNTSGPLGLMRVKGVAAVYGIALAAWWNDDSADHAKTMAALDRALNRVEAVARTMENWGLRAAG